MKILLVYPQYPDTFWSFKHALKFISKKASHPPLGLLTIAAMLPANWEKKLVDMNVTALKDKDIEWADYVFISAMVVQRDSARESIARCHTLGTKVVAGGPLFTSERDEFDEVDHLVLDEGESTLPPFLEDLEKGQAQHIYTSNERPDISKTPIPQWSLIDMRNYASMSVQYSRGCPYNCEFCNVVILNGHKPRTKSTEHMLAEINAIYNQGWRDALFIVDDNFIGNKKKLKAEILPAIIQWSKEKKYPFLFFTEVSINLADDENLMRLMAEANFSRVFVGIETPNEDSLAECNKLTNKGRDLVASVKKIQSFGFEVQGGFIVGFDNDPLSIFRSQINFIQNSGIVTAMVGLLNAPRGTRLYQRLSRENRLLKDTTGDNTDGSINFIPTMNYDTLIDGYKYILNTIYAPKQYYERITTFLKEYRPRQVQGISKLRFYYVRAFIKSMWVLGVMEKGRTRYWRFFISTLVKRPKLFPLSISLSVYGIHFRRVAKSFSKTPTLKLPSPIKLPPNLTNTENT
ncbi:MAG: B12-binding domain-containing radical SAM protein [Dehalococcoidales bacterium]|nr:MAG: B12-binding domain-containing radical SAM protein [Dehalococcoidales bacterium]